jgi:hypothetical protein
MGSLLIGFPLGLRRSSEMGKKSKGGKGDKGSKGEGQRAADLKKEERQKRKDYRKVSTLLHKQRRPDIMPAL